MNNYIKYVLFIFCITQVCFAENLPETIDGFQRNKIERYINERIGSGGSGSGNAVTNGFNYFTSYQEFADAVKFYGATTNLGPFNLADNLIMTNGTITGASTPQLHVNDIRAVGANTVEITLTPSTGILNFLKNGTSQGYLPGGNWRDSSGVNSLILDSHGLTDSSGNPFIYGTTRTITGTSTNTGNIIAINTVGASNVVIQSFDKWVKWAPANSETNFLENFPFPRQSTFLHVSATNMPNGAQFNNNGTIYTNIGQRATISPTWIIPESTTAKSTVGVWVVDGGFTNIFGMMSSYGGILNNLSTNSSSPVRLNPSVLFAFTNVDVSAGTPSLVPGRTTIQFD